MVEAATPAPLEVIQAQLVLELLIAPLDPPAELGQPDEVGNRGRRRQGREPILRRLEFAAGSLDQEVLFRSRLRALLIAMADRTRTRAKRERMRPRVPARQLTGATLRRAARRLGA
jgi:hypothetical protein